MKLVEEMKSIMEEHFRDTLGEPDWVMREIPSIRSDLWEELSDMINTEEFRIMSCSWRQENSGDMFFRGTIMISPKGIENLANANKSN